MFAQTCFVLVGVLEVVWAHRLYRLGLARRYRVLFAYLLATGLSTLVAAAILHFATSQPPLMVFYGWYLVTTTALEWMLLFALVLEAATRMVEGYSGLQRLGQIVIHVVLAATGVLIFCMTVLDVSLSTWRELWHAYERAVYPALTGAFFLLFVIAKGFRLPVARNLKIIFGSLGTLFAVYAGLVLLASLKVEMDPNVIRPGLGLVAVILTAGGAFLFSKRGEGDPLRAAPVGIGSQEAGRVLQDINGVLVRVLRSNPPRPSSPESSVSTR
jgi:hypothetical protein